MWTMRHSKSILRIRDRIESNQTEPKRIFSFRNKISNYLFNFCLVFGARLKVHSIIFLCLLSLALSNCVLCEVLFIWKEILFSFYIDFYFLNYRSVFFSLISFWPLNNWFNAHITLISSTHLTNSAPFPNSMPENKYLVTKIECFLFNVTV